MEYYCLLMAGIGILNWVYCSGQDEGVYAWVAANYALGTLGGDRQETTGIVELAGSSVQVLFILLSHLFR